MDIKKEGFIMEGLEEKQLSNIVPFSGLPQEMTPTEQIIKQGGAMQRVQTAYTTAVAVQKPRSIGRTVKNVLEEAKLAGSAFYYRWEVKNQKTNRTSVVQGASIDLAMCIARNYGNCALDVDVEETITHFHFKGYFIDLETGFTVPRLFRQRKKQNIGSKYDADRAEDIVFQIGQSKAQRNAIVKACPNWLIEKAIETARNAEIANIKPENLVITRASVLDYFERYGVSQDRIEAKIGLPVDQWTAENIVDLKAAATALKEGRISAEELFPPVEEPKKEAAAPDTTPETVATESYKPDPAPEDNPEGKDTPQEDNGAEKAREVGANIDPAVATEFEALTGLVAKKFYAFREYGMDNFFSQYSKVLYQFSDPIKDFIREKCENMKKSGHPEYLELFENALAPKEEAAATEAHDTDQQDLWNGLNQCPEMGGNNVPRGRCQKCTKAIDEDGSACPALTEAQVEAIKKARQEQF